MPITVKLGDDMGTLSIVRDSGLEHGKDKHRYRVTFCAPDWRDGTAAEVAFNSCYSHGLLVLTENAIKALLRQYPELKSARFGIPRNRVQCKVCGSVLWSQFTHDFVTCKCGRVSADGGYEYFKTVGRKTHIRRLKEPWQKRKARSHG